MTFYNLFKEASNNSRYQDNILKNMLFPEPCTKYAFSLHALTKSRAHYPYELDLSSLPVHAFLYTFGGSASLYIDKQLYNLEKNIIAWFDCSKGFHIEITTTNQDWDFILLFASGDTLHNYHDIFIQNHDITISTQNSPNISGVLHQIYSNLISMQQSRPVIFSKLLCDLATYLALDRSIQTQFGTAPKQIIQIVSYIKNHYSEKITLDTLSNHFATSKYSLSRDFTNYMNQSLIDYLIDYRIEESKKLLQFTDQTISEIADATGFSSITNFIQQFKKRTDSTPNAYRKQNQIYSSKQALADHNSHI